MSSFDCVFVVSMIGIYTIIAYTQVCRNHEMFQALNGNARHVISCDIYWVSCMWSPGEHLKFGPTSRLSFGVFFKTAKPYCQLCKKFLAFNFILLMSSEGRCSLALWGCPPLSPTPPYRLDRRIPLILYCR